MKVALIALSLMMCLETAIAQVDDLKEPEKAKEGVTVGGWTSQVMISTDFSSMYLNLVGSGIRYTKGDFMVALSLFPTLRFREDPHRAPNYDVRPFVTPGFSVGALFQYKHLLIGFPVSYSYDSRWHPTVGAGVKIGR